MSNNSVENKSVPAVPPYAWVILVVVFLASVAAPLNQTKVSPLLSVIRSDLNMSLGLSGWLNSVFAFTGLILALPTGIFLKRFGPKIMGIAALSCLAVGAALGAVSNSAGMLIFSRVIEGNGLGLISVVGPSVVAMWFPPEKRGIPMGIWATWFPVGALTMYLSAPMMAKSFGWKFVWWFGAGFAILTLVLYIIFMRMPPGMERTAQKKTQSSILSEFVSTIKLLNNRQIWMLGLGLCLYSLPTMAVTTFYPTFLREVRGYSLSQASQISSISIFLVIFSAPMAGIISDKIGSRRLLFSIPFLIMAVMGFLPYKVVGWQIIALMTINGLIGGAIPTTTFAAASEIMKKPELAGLGVAVVMAGSNLGMVIGPIYLGNLVELFGNNWFLAGCCLIPLSIIGFIVMWRIDIR